MKEIKSFKTASRNLTFIYAVFTLMYLVFLLLQVFNVFVFNQPYSEHTYSFILLGLILLVFSLYCFKKNFQPLEVILVKLNELSIKYWFLWLLSVLKRGPYEENSKRCSYILGK